MKIDQKTPGLVLVLPASWREIPPAMPRSRTYERRDGMFTIVSIDILADGQEWIHASTSFKHHLPTWEDLNEVKDLFVGRWRKAIIVMPPDDQKVNIHDYCMHIYAPKGQDPIPDFRAEGGGI